jgi:hypothetical protein
MRQAIASTQVIRISTPLPSPSSLMPPSSGVPESRPSRAAAAVQKTTDGSKLFGKYAVYVTFVLTMLAQVISFANDPKNGPVVRALIILAATAAGKTPPPPELSPEQQQLPTPEWQPLGTPVPTDEVTPVRRRSFERTEDGGQGGQAGQGGQRNRR